MRSCIAAFLSWGIWDRRLFLPRGNVRAELTKKTSQNKRYPKPSLCNHVTLPRVSPVIFLVVLLFEVRLDEHRPGGFERVPQGLIECLGRMDGARLDTEACGEFHKIEIRRVQAGQ